MSEPLADLQSVIRRLEGTPYCTGTIPLSRSFSTVYYRSRDLSANFLDFTHPTDAELENLAKACQPATFGFDQKDVLDEAYRKAGKIDTDRFAVNFSPSDLGIIETISDSLLRGRLQSKSIRSELYKLNVYGPGGFFKPHVDTPRSDSMFGSLVVVLPTVHEGGCFIIRHGGKEWTLDSAQKVRDQSSPQATFIAFYSDVEHEISHVISGYRVTLTYNLYRNPKKTSVPFGNDNSEKEISEALGRLLKNQTFLPYGGCLGFGLGYKYPFNPKSSRPADIEDCLKGTDAAIKRGCNLLSLDVAIKVIYRDDDYDGRCALVDSFVDLHQNQIEEGVPEYLRESEGAQIISSFDDREHHDEVAMAWVTPLAKMNSFSTPYIQYGNEATISCAYGEVCLVAKIPPTDERD